MVMNGYDIDVNVKCLEERVTETAKELKDKEIEISDQAREEYNLIAKAVTAHDEYSSKSETAEDHRRRLYSGIAGVSQGIQILIGLSHLLLRVTYYMSL